MTTNHVPINPPKRTDRLESLEFIVYLTAGGSREIHLKDSMLARSWHYEDPKEGARISSLVMNGVPEVNASGVRCTRDVPSARTAVQTGELAAFSIYKPNKHGVMEIDVAATRVDRGDFAAWLWRNHKMLPDFLREYVGELEAPPMVKADTPYAQRWENTTQAMLYALAEHHGYLKSGSFRDAAKHIAKTLETSGHHFDFRTIEERLEDRLQGGCIVAANKARKPRK